MPEFDPILYILDSRLPKSMAILRAEKGTVMRSRAVGDHPVFPIVTASSLGHGLSRHLFSLICGLRRTIAAPRQSGWLTG